MRILISAGELSGDEHGASLVRSLRALLPEVELFGMGGSNLRSAGLELLVDADKQASVMGFSELLGKLGAVRSAFRTLERALIERRPACLVIINYSDFNLRLARRAKQLGIPVLFYIPPQVWAWREGRIRAIRACVDRLAVIFPFEADYYRERGVEQVTYVGHPTLDSLPSRRITPDEREKLLLSAGLDPRKPVVVFFPGSRTREIAVHLPVMISGFREIRVRRPDVQALFNATSPEIAAEWHTAAAAMRGVAVVSFDSLKALQCGTAGCIKSGTSNLQAALTGLPFVMVYRASRISALLVRALVKVQAFSIVNIIRPNTVTELLQDNLNSETICREVLALLENSAVREGQLKGFREIHAALAESESRPSFHPEDNVSTRVARLVLELC